MSTRCQVKVISRGKEVMLYHHCDGYPEGVGYCLLKLLKKNEDGWRASELVTTMIKMVILKLLLESIAIFTIPGLF